MSKAPNQKIQDAAIVKVNEDFSNYNTLLNSYRTKWLNLFRATYIFETDRNADGQSKIFFPKAFEQVEKVAPRIYGNAPKFVVSLNVPVNNKYPEADMLQNMEAVQKSLNYFWKIGQCQKKGRSWVKGGLITGVMWAKVEFERKTFKDEVKEVFVNEEGEQVERTTEIEKVLTEYPTFRVPDIFDMFFDPRVELETDMRSIIENTDDVSYSDLLADKDNYFNLKALKTVLGESYSSDGGNQKLNKFNQEGIPTTEVNKGGLNIKKFYGYFSETGECEDEALYEIWVARNDTVIKYKKIKFMPFVKFVPIDVPSQGVGIGLVEPIDKLQKAYNLTRNQRAENVSLVLNRMWVMKKGSGIDPRKLISRAGNILRVKDLGDIAPLDTPDITQSAFAEANSINTEIQQALGTIDTTQDNAGNGFTNLATGQKIRWQEYNVRFKAIKDNFEEALSRLGEMFLLLVGQEANQNPLIADENNQEFYEIAKTAFDQPGDFYRVSVLANSTASDSIENKRDETLGFGQLALAYKGQGVPINMTKIWEDIASSFPGRNPKDYMEAEQPQPEQGASKPIAQSVIDEAKVQPSSEEALNKSLTNV